LSDTKSPVSRIYRLHDVKSGDVAFCRARNPAQALNYVTRDRYRLSVATTDDVLGVPRSEVLDATLPGVHPDQAPLPLENNNDAAHSAS
jgi:hypothetical protein